MQLVPVEMSRSPGHHEIRRALDRLIHDDHVDALWVLNDSVLLEPELIAPPSRLPVNSVFRAAVTERGLRPRW